MNCQVPFRNSVASPPKKASLKCFNAIKQFQTNSTSFSLCTFILFLSLKNNRHSEFQIFFACLHAAHFTVLTTTPSLYFAGPQETARKLKENASSPPTPPKL